MMFVRVARLEVGTGRLRGQALALHLKLAVHLKLTVHLNQVLFAQLPLHEPAGRSRLRPPRP